MFDSIADQRLKQALGSVLADKLHVTGAERVCGWRSKYQHTLLYHLAQTRTVNADAFVPLPVLALNKSKHLPQFCSSAPSGHSLMPLQWTVAGRQVSLEQRKPLHRVPSENTNDNRSILTVHSIYITLHYTQYFSREYYTVLQCTIYSTSTCKKTVWSLDLDFITTLSDVSPALTNVSSP